MKLNVMDARLECMEKSLSGRVALQEEEEEEKEGEEAEDEQEEQEVEESEIEEEEDLQQKLLPYMPQKKIHDKISAEQKAFFLMWLSNENVTTCKGAMKNAQQMKADGIKAGIWNGQFVPPGQPSLEKYLYHKIRAYVKNSAKKMKQ